MSKLRFAAIILAIGFSGSAFAQRLSSEQREACKPDVEKLCSDTKRGGGRIMACLSKQYDQLSDDCKKVVDSRKKQ
jgi:Cysteine rich repeat